MRCLSNLEGRTPADCTSMAAKEELDTYQKTCCCLWTQIGSAACCDDGWIEFDSKCCCCVLDGSIPAGYTPGVVCCGATPCCANLPEKDSAGAKVAGADQ